MMAETVFSNQITHQFVTEHNHVTDFISEMNADVCFQNNPSGTGCHFDNYSFGEEFLDPDIRQNEALLIVDYDLTPAANVLYYQDRILNFYEVDGSAHIIPNESHVRVPKVFGDGITALKSTHAIPTESAVELANVISDTYGNNIPYATSHGLTVFAALADHARNQPVVFLDISKAQLHKAIPEVFCAVQSAEDEVHLGQLKSYAEKIESEITNLYKKHHIKFVNVSWGLVLNTIKSDWENTCNSSVPDNLTLKAILDTYQPVFKSLFGTADVLATHAAYQGTFNADFEIPFEWASEDFQNRMRVGVMGYLGNDIPLNGSAGRPHASEVSPENLELVDLYLNSGCQLYSDYGCRSEDPLQLRIPYGLGTVALPELNIQTSFVAPVGLAYFINLRNSPAFCQFEMNQSLINEIKAVILESCEGESACIFHDPLLTQGFNEPFDCEASDGTQPEKVPVDSKFGLVMLFMLVLILSLRSFYQKSNSSHN
ncbi:MAG: hypothetical protein R3E90_06005 [Marinicella sp.]